MVSDAADTKPGLEKTSVIVLPDNAKAWCGASNCLIRKYSTPKIAAFLPPTFEAIIFESARKSPIYPTLGA